MVARTRLVVAGIQRTHVEIFARVVVGSVALAVHAQVLLRALVAVIALDVGLRAGLTAGLFVARVVCALVVVIADDPDADALAK